MSNDKSIARKIIDREPVDEVELRYLLYLALCELEPYSGSINIDRNEVCSVSELLNAMEQRYGDYADEDE